MNNDMILDLYALHGRDAAISAVKHHARLFIDSVTEKQVTDRRAELTIELLAEKKFKEDHTAARLKHEARE